MTPHHIDQPHPTRQNKTVNNCPAPINTLIINDPTLDLGSSLCEKRGLPMHKQNNPLKTVPEQMRLQKLVTNTLYYKLRVIELYLFRVQKC